MVRRLYAWHWQEGGHNSCMAESREEAIAEGNRVGAPREYAPGRFTMRLTVNVATLCAGKVACDFVLEQDRQYAGD